MTYQNLGYWIAQANDLSTGRHPTGWTSGQRWSETSGEWMVMYDGSQSALVDMTNQRNTWEARADQAWGPSRNWPDGESWEAAYGRVLPAGSGASPLLQTNSNAALTANGATITWSTVTSNDSWGSGVTLTCPRTGFFHVVFTLMMPATGNVDDAFETVIKKNGANVSSGRTMAQGNHGAGWYSTHNFFVYNERAVLAAGTTYQATILCSDNGRAFPAGNGTFTATFVPTQTYPH